MGKGRRANEADLDSLSFALRIALLQEFFKKIKFKYLEQEAKETFLKLILAEDPVQIDREDNNRLGELRAPPSSSFRSFAPLRPSRTAISLTVPPLFAYHQFRGREQGVQGYSQGFEDRARCSEERGWTSR